MTGTDCIFDDSTECDCARCTAAEDRFWREQNERDDDISDRCFDAEMAEAFYRGDSVRKPPTGRQRTRALWRKRGRR